MSTETSHPTDAPSSPATDTPGSPIAAPPPPPPRRQGVGRTRLGSVWVGLIGMALAFVALLSFGVQNPARTDLHFLWLDGRVPLGVAMLFAAIAGILLIAIPGTGRILQLRRRSRGHVHGGPS